MTRGEMVNLSDRLLLAAFGSPFGDDPITSMEPGGLLDIAADEVCRKTDCFYDVQTCDLTAGQATYGAPTIYRVKELYCVDASGNTWELIARTPAQMTREYGASWRDWAAWDPPNYAIWQGTTKIRLVPAPSVSRGAALVFEGFAVTTSKASGSTAHLWPGEADDCPLPDDSQMAVVYRLCALRCLPLLTRVAGAADQLAAFTTQYREERGDLEANTARRYPAQRLGPGHRRLYTQYL